MIIPRSFLFCLLATHLQAAEPTLDWIAVGGGEKSDKTRGVTVDTQGNIFLTGETLGEGTFGTHKRADLGSTDAFLSKTTPDGKILWVSSFGGSLVDRTYGVVTDAKGNAYVTGHYQSTDVQALGQTLSNAGDYDIFTAKYDPKGKLLWVRTAGGAGYDYGHGIVMDSKGDVIICGSLVGEAKFGDQSINIGNGSRAIFWAKYDQDGNLRWVHTTSGKLNGSGHGIAADGTDNLYIGGSISGTGMAGSVPVSVASGQAAVVLKVSPLGEPLWVATVPGAPSAIFHEITADEKGRVWGAGIFKQKVTLSGSTFESTGVKDSDGLLVHFSPEGKELWSHVIQGPGIDYCLGVATDGVGHVFVTGEFSATAKMAGKTLTSQGATDIFTASFDEKGGLEWIQTAGGAKSDSAYILAWRPGYLILGGACTAPLSFGVKSLDTSAAADAYAAKLKLP
jgi:hypothetical protein